jgi:hypothetical protein
MKLAKWITASLLALLLLTPAFAQKMNEPIAEEEQEYSPVGEDEPYDDESYVVPKDENSFEVTTGYQASSTDGNLNLAAQYEVVDDTPLLGIDWRNSRYEDTYFGLKYHRTNSKQFYGRADLDLGRSVRVRADTTGLIHRLWHDPLDNLEAVSDIKVVRRTDFDPNAEYVINYRVFDAGLVIQPPQTPAVQFRGALRRQERTGNRQLLSTSHCTSCHVTAQSQRVDETQSDYTFGVHGRVGVFDLDYAVNGRDYTDGSPVATAPFEQAIHPGLLTTPFNDRVWFQNGSFPVDVDPDQKRTEQVFRLRARSKNSTAGGFNFTAAYSDTENTNYGNGYTFTGYRALYTAKFGKPWKVNFYVRRNEIENDTVSLDLVALNGLTTPPVTGYPIPDGSGGFVTETHSYESWRFRLEEVGSNGDPRNFNAYDRFSALNRTEDLFGIDAFWRVNPRASSRFTYRYRTIDRDFVVLADGTGKTTKHTFKFNWNHKVRKRLRWDNNLVVHLTDNPYVAVNGGMRAFAGFLDEANGLVLGYSPPGSPAVGGTFGPKGPNSLQYYQLHALRVANLGNVPTEYFRVRSNATWSPKGRHALNGNIRYSTGENDELDYSTWERTSWGVGINFWTAATMKLHYTFGIDYAKQETEAANFVPLMDG